MRRYDRDGPGQVAIHDDRHCASAARSSSGVQNRQRRNRENPNP